jgi:hypothetical protein
MNTILPSQIEASESADGIRFRLPAPAGSWDDVQHEVCVTADGKLRWQPDSKATLAANELAVAELAQFIVSPFGPLAVLAVETREGTTHAICTGYPRSWLGALAAELSRHCGLSVGPASTRQQSRDDDVRSLVEKLQTAGAAIAGFQADRCRQLGEVMQAVDEGIDTASTTASAAGAAFQEDPDQPPSSQVIYLARDDSVALLVPPGGAGFFFLLGCLLCAFAALPTLASLMTGFRADNGSYAPVAMVVFFWAVALGVFLPAFHYARAQVTLTVTGDELEMVETSPVHTRCRSWKRAELREIRCADNGWVSGGEDDSTQTPVAQLHILPRDEKKVGLLTGRDAAEIRWIAAVLCRALHLTEA